MKKRFSSSIDALRQLSGLLLSFCLIWFPGCGKPDDSTLSLAGSLITEEPTLELDYQWAGPRATFREWDLVATADRADWSLREGGHWDDEDGLALTSTRTRIRHGEPIDAASVTGIRMVLDSAKACRLSVGWGGRPPTWADSGPPAGASDTLHVELTTQPEWKDEIGSLLLVVRNCAGRRVSRILLLGQAEDPGARLASNLPAAWKVTLANDTRSAVLAPPGVVHRWTLTEAIRVGSLRFGFGLYGAPDSALSLEVRALAGNKERLLTTQRYEPAEWLEDGGWRDFSIPLEGLPAGSELSITTQSAADPWPIVDSVPVIGAPRVVAGRGAGRLNVLLLSIDTLRADHLSLYGYGRETSPNIDRRARASGITFSNVVAPAGWTLPSHVSMFSGVSALRHGVNFSTSIPSSLKLLAESFGEAGHETIAFSAGGYVSAAFGLSRGFQSFRTRRPENPSATSSFDELSDGVEQFGRWLESAPGKPFFAFFHTYEVHAPYWARSPYFESFGGNPEELPLGYGSSNTAKDEAGRESRRFVVPTGGGELREADPVLATTLYDSGIAHMDSQIERLFAELEEAGVLDETVVVLTSDHGEALGEHDFAGHGSPHDEVVMVPLVIWHPGHRQPATVSEQIQLVDLAPTLLDLAGLPAPAGLDGHSLRPLWEKTGEYPQRPAWIHAGNYGIAMRLANRMKYIWHRAPWDYFGPGEELYDLRSDPAEARDLSASDEALLASARELTREAVAQHLPGFRLTFANRESGTYRVLVSSAGNRGSGVTAFGCRSLDWLPPRQVSFEVSPGEPCELTLEYLHAVELSIEARPLVEGTLVDGTLVDGALVDGALVAGDKASLRLDLDTAEVAEPRTYVMRGDRWELDVSSPEGGLELRCEWKRPPAAGGEAEVQMEDELVDQLRALGYIE